MEEDTIHQNQPAAEEDEYEEVKAISVDEDPMNELQFGMNKPMAHYQDQEEYQEIFKHLTDDPAVTAVEENKEEVRIYYCVNK